MAEILLNMMERVTNVAAENFHDYAKIEERMITLKTEVQNLRNRAADVVSILEEEEVRTGKKRKREVRDWLADVTRKKVKCDSLDQKVKQTRFYNFCSRLCLGKQIREMSLEVEKLVKMSRFSDGLFLEIFSTKGKPLVMTEWKSQITLEENFSIVWGWIMNNIGSRIGIYGMGGVGKTTLAMRIHNKLLGDPKFKGHVYWIHASQDSNVLKLQNDIAAVIKLDFSSKDSQNQRAAQLFEALNRRKPFVLILDDVWNPFDVEKVGIPDGKDGSKLLITSRSIDVCHRIGCQKNLKVNVLCQTEAWDLFLNKLGDGIKLSSETEKIARELSKRCSGLPLGIITMSGSMRGVTDSHEWRDALEELKESSMGPNYMELEVFPILLCSFNRLRDPKLQQCFLYCSLYPEDYKIPREELISKFLSEELMDKRKSRQASFDQGHAILNKLENASLLEKADYNCVKMHDLIRDVALRIARNEKRFMVKSGLQLNTIPELQEWKDDLDKVSLMYSKISCISPGVSPNCPKLSTLILRWNPLEKIPDSFFQHLCGLKILDLSYIWIEELPNSTSDLESLNSLLLTCCVDLKYVPPLTKLKELKELDLNRNKIKELPIGMQNLVNLKCLNIGDLNCLEMIPQGMLSNLSHLQRLIVSDHLPVHVEDLQGLKSLEEFQGLMHDVHDLNKFIISQRKSGNLTFYNIVVGKSDSWSRCHPSSRRITDKLLTLKEHCLESGKREEKVLLPPDIQELKIAKCSGLKSCMSDVFTSLDSTSSLKCLRISHCDDVECILKLPSGDIMVSRESYSPYQNLEKLILSWLPNLISLVRYDVGATVPTYSTFSALKKLRIEFCNRIKKLFTLRVLQNLDNIQDIYVSECAALEEIIGDDEEYSLGAHNTNAYNNDQTIAVLPKLRALSLKWLPDLKNICKEKMACDSIETIVLVQCHKLKRLPLLLPHIDGQASPPRTLKQIRIGKEDGEWWEMLEWDHPSDRSVLQPFVKCLNLGLQTVLHDPKWKTMIFACLFIRRLQVRSRS